MGLARAERRGLHLPHVPQAAPAGLGRAPAGTATPGAGGAPAGPTAPPEPPPQGGARPRLPPPRLTGPRGRSCRPRSPAPPVGTGVSPGRGASSADPPRGARAERRRPTCGSGRSGGSSRSAPEAGGPTPMLGADREQEPARRAALWRPRPHKPRPPTNPAPSRVATPSAPPAGGRSRGHTPDPLARSPAPRGTASRGPARRGSPAPQGPAPHAGPPRGRAWGFGAEGGECCPRPGRRAGSRPGQACRAERLAAPALHGVWPRSAVAPAPAALKVKGATERVGARPARGCGVPGAAWGGRARAHRSRGGPLRRSPPLQIPWPSNTCPSGTCGLCGAGPGVRECLLRLLPGKPGGPFSHPPPLFSPG